MLVDAMPVPAPSSPARRALHAGLFLTAGLLAACSSNTNAPVAPIVVNPHPAPVPMFRVVGEPRVAVRFAGSLTEPIGATGLTGTFSVTLTDSSGRRAFLNDVRLNNVPMHEEFDVVSGLPSRYLLDASEIPGLAFADSLRFEAIDGGDYTPPFSYLILPSHFTLPPDSTQLHTSQDLTLPWGGVVEHVIVTLADLTGKKLRFNLQVENFTGATEVFIPGSDLAGLYPGEIQVGTYVLDTELRVGASFRTQIVQMDVKQYRVWNLGP